MEERGDCDGQGPLEWRRKATVPMPRAATSSPQLIDTLAPMLLCPRRYPFDSEDWVFELKMDGWRLLAQVAGGKVVLRSRRGMDVTSWFPEVTKGLCTLESGPHVLDGEVCVLDDIGRSDFNKLHARALQRGRRDGSDPVVFCAFDLLVQNGESVCAAPLEERKARLENLLAGKPQSTLYVSGVPVEGRWLYEQAVALKLEGVVGKRLGSPYRPGERSTDWVKVKRPGAVTAQRFKRDAM